MNLAVVFDIEASARFQVGQAARIGYLYVIHAADPAADFFRWRNQVHPDRADALQIVGAGDRDLTQSAIAEFEGGNGRLFVAVVAVIDQLLENLVGKQCQDRVGAFLDLIPHHEALIGIERLDDVGNLPRRHQLELLPKLLAILVLDLDAGLIEVGRPLLTHEWCHEFFHPLL